MRKNKDFALDSPHSAAPRCRPLTPYGGRGKLHHPLWKHMKVAGAVLRLALENAGLRCWHLQSTGVFATGLLADHDHLAHAGAPGGRTVLFAFDLVKMFTNLDTSAVLRAVTWILFSNSGWERARSAAGRGSRYPRGAYVSMAAGRYKARVGSGLSKRAGEVYITLRTVLDLVTFDVQEAVMKCGQHLLWQREGVAMGSFLSAIISGITVAVAEHRFYARLPPDTAERVLGRRYADDGAVLIREWPGVPPARELFDLFAASCYPAPLQLEVENHHGRINLLESTVDVTGATQAVVQRL
jgi:hypothetical protein